MRRATSGRFMRRLCLRIHKPGVHSLNEACGFGLNLSRGRTEILPESRASSPCRVRYSRPSGKHSYTLISTELKVAEGLVNRLRPGSPNGARRTVRARPASRAKTWGLGISRTSAIVQFFCLFLSPKAFVTDASLRS